MRLYKKYVIIEKTGSFKTAYYLFEGELIICGTYTRSWTDAEIKQDVVENGLR